jgi:hypothetical protein
VNEVPHMFVRRGRPTHGAEPADPRPRVELRGAVRVSKLTGHSRELTVAQLQQDNCGKRSNILQTPPKMARLHRDRVCVEEGRTLTQ